MSRAHGLALVLKGDDGKVRALPPCETPFSTLPLKTLSFPSTIMVNKYVGNTCSEDLQMSRSPRTARVQIWPETRVSGEGLPIWKPRSQAQNCGQSMPPLGRGCLGAWVPGHREGPSYEDGCCVSTTIIFVFITIVTLTFMYCSLHVPCRSKHFTGMNSLGSQAMP